MNRIRIKKREPYVWNKPFTTISVVQLLFTIITLTHVHYSVNAIKIKSSTHSSSTTSSSPSNYNYNNYHNDEPSSSLYYQHVSSTVFKLNTNDNHDENVQIDYLPQNKPTRSHKNKNTQKKQTNVVIIIINSIMDT